VVTGSTTVSVLGPGAHARPSVIELAHLGTRITRLAWSSHHDGLLLVSMIAEEGDRLPARSRQLHLVVLGGTTSTRLLDAGRPPGGGRFEPHSDAVIFVQCHLDAIDLLSLGFDPETRVEPGEPPSRPERPDR